MSSERVGPFAGFLLLVIRGLLLWLLVPTGFLIWMVTLQWALRNRVSLGSFLGWLDNNLVYGLQRGPLRLFFRKPTVRWIPAKCRSEVTHRIRGVDFV